jgi:hypothetical protein
VDGLTLQGGSNQVWQRQGDRLVNPNTKKCLAVTPEAEPAQVWAGPLADGSVAVRGGEVDL